MPLKPSLLGNSQKMMDYRVLSAELDHCFDQTVAYLLIDRVFVPFVLSEPVKNLKILTAPKSLAVGAVLCNLKSQR